jgi:hypothetical protein
MLLASYLPVQWRVYIASYIIKFVRRTHGLGYCGRAQRAWVGIAAK